MFAKTTRTPGKRSILRAKLTRSYPRLHADTAPSNAVGQIGGLLLTEIVHTSGLSQRLKHALAAWKKPYTFHGPAKVLTDIAIALAPAAA